MMVFVQCGAPQQLPKLLEADARYDVCVGSLTLQALDDYFVDDYKQKIAIQTSLKLKPLYQLFN